MATKFEDLRVAYTNWHTEHADYYRQSVIFANRFTRDFKKYIGAPDSYNEFGKKTVTPYVRAVAVADELVTTPTRDFELTGNEEGFFEFGIQITLDMGPQTFPKKSFSYHIGFCLKNERCEMKVGGGDFDFALDSNDEINRVFDFMVDLLKAGLSQKPWERVENRRIGFLPDLPKKAGR